MYNSQFKYTRYGAVFPGDASKVAHDSHRSLTFHLKTCSHFRSYTHLVKRACLRSNSAKLSRQIIEASEKGE
jgi:hypothetical protein